MPVYSSRFNKYLHEAGREYVEAHKYVYDVNTRSFIAVPVRTLLRDTRHVILYIITPKSRSVRQNIE